MVAAGAALWGTIGIFINQLDISGFSSIEIVALRVVSATFILFFVIKFRYPDQLSIRLNHLFYFIGTGILSICFFNWSYFTAIKETSLSVAVILLYTGPAFVVILSRLLFREKLTLPKIAALILTFTGAALVVELIPYSAGSISWYGIIVGTGAGFGYALYSVFGKYALKKYSPITIIFYTFLTASVFMLPFSGIMNIHSIESLANLNTLLIVAGLGIFPTALAYLLYTEGLARIEAGSASITSIVEPVTAALIGVILYGDKLNIYQSGGMLLVIISVTAIQLHRNNRIPVSRI